MTFKEKLQMEHPEFVDKKYSGGCQGCPYHYGYEKKINCEFWETDEKCEQCWSREMPSTEPLTEKEKMIDAMSENAYNQGLNDAWKLAKKVADMAHGTRNVILGTNNSNNGVCDILCDFTPQEVLAKLKAYEEAQKQARLEEMKQIKVGDVVIWGGVKALVMDEDGIGKVVLFTECGCIWVDKSNVKKTGEHINLNSILEQIGE